MATTGTTGKTILNSFAPTVIARRRKQTNLTSIVTSGKRCDTLIVQLVGYSRVQVSGRARFTEVKQLVTYKNQRVAGSIPVRRKPVAHIGRAADTKH